jgi:glycogen(starch) synthase
MDRLPHPLRILMTADTVGGVWTFALDLAAGLRKYGAEIFLATMGPAPGEHHRAMAERADNVTWIHRTCALEWMDQPWEDVEKSGRWLLGLQHSLGADLVHLNDFSHGALPWNAPVVVGAHSCVLTWWRAVKNAKAPSHCNEYRRRTRLGLAAAHRVAVPTCALLAAMEKEHGPLKQAVVVPNGRGPGPFRPGRKTGLIATAGRLWDEAKNVAFLERIAPCLDWPVYLAGDTRFQESALHPCPHLQKLGVLSEPELASFLGKAGIYAAPACYEPFGLGILEAALSGCALALSDLPSLREIWGDAAVFLPPDPARWTQTLNRLSRDAGERQDLALRALAQARRYSVETMAGGYMDIYRELLSFTPTFAPSPAQGLALIP